MVERSLIVVYYNGFIKIRESIIRFLSGHESCFYKKNFISLENLEKNIEQNKEIIKGKRVSHIKCWPPMS